MERELTEEEEIAYKKKKENSKSWSLFRMNQLCSGGFIRIYEKKDEIIK